MGRKEEIGMDFRKVSIGELLLDPNNYRLRGAENYKYVEDKNINNVMVQKRVLKMLRGDNSANIKDLLDSFKENGYLKIDNIIVKNLGKENEYVVVEGNRRVAALKTLKELYDDGMDIGNLDPGIFDGMDVVLYDVSDKEYEIIMGLRHVSGIKEWGDYEQAELIANLARNHKMSLREIANSLGISALMVKKRLNTYYALEIFRNDQDYGWAFAPNKLSSIFYEIMGKGVIRDQWLGWDEELNSFTNKKNMRRLFSWLVPNEADDGKLLEPIITKRDEIRVLAKLIMDEEALVKLEESRSVAVALEESGVYLKEGLKDSLKQIIKLLNKLNLGALTELTKEDKQTVKEMLGKLENQSGLINKLIE